MRMEEKMRQQNKIIGDRSVKKRMQTLRKKMKKQKKKKKQMKTVKKRSK